MTVAVLSLREIAQRYGIAPEALTRLAEDGVIQMTHNPDGGPAAISVPTVDNATAARIILDEIRPQQYEHLRGKRIRLMEAARQYQVSEQNLFNWAKQKYVRVLDQGFQQLELDAADVKYVTDVFKRAKKLTGSSIRAGWVLKKVIRARRHTTNPS